MQTHFNPFFSNAESITRFSGRDKRPAPLNTAVANQAALDEEERLRLEHQRTGADVADQFARLTDAQSSAAGNDADRKMTDEEDENYKKELKQLSSGQLNQNFVREQKRRMAEAAGHRSETDLTMDDVQTGVSHMMKMADSSDPEKSKRAKEFLENLQQRILASLSSQPSRSPKRAGSKSRPSSPVVGTSSNK